jgi:peptide subunit release factor RF-3
MESEYNVLTVLERLPYNQARWVKGPEEDILRIPSRSDVLVARDSDENYVTLFSSEFYIRYTAEKFPNLRFETME